MSTERLACEKNPCELHTGHAPLAGPMGIGVFEGVPLVSDPPLCGGGGATGGGKE